MPPDVRKRSALPIDILGFPRIRRSPDLIRTHRQPQAFRTSDGTAEPDLLNHISFDLSACRHALLARRSWVRLK